MEINRIIHREMQARGHVEHSEHPMRVLIARQEITGADRQWAEQYDPGDVVRYTKGSRTYGIEAGEYTPVERVNAEENLLPSKHERGEGVTIGPPPFPGVTPYPETDRAFWQSD